MPPPTEPPDSARGTKGPRGPGRNISWGKVVVLLLVAWLVFLVAVPIWAVGRIDKVDITPEGDRPGEQPGRTYLLVGSDSRKGITEAENRRLAQKALLELLCTQAG